MRIALTCNIKPQNMADRKSAHHYAEWDDEGTIRAVENALSERHEVTRVIFDRNIVENLKWVAPDMVFNMAEGINSPSRESQIPVICEMLGIPYTGSDGFTLAACLDKARAKETLSYHDVPTPISQVAYSPSQPLNGLGLPVIVKPLREGSSMGVMNDSVVFDKDDIAPRIERVIRLYNQPAMVEAFLNGREFTAALIGNGDDIRALPLVEINFDSLPGGAVPIYSYEAKWIWDSPESPLRIFICPAELGADERREIEDICVRAFRSMGCRDWCRIDVRMDGAGKPHILELNPLPGVLPDPDENSCFPKAARAAGISYNRLINLVLDHSCKRYGLNGGG